MNTGIEAINLAVAQQYENFAFPDYSLLLPLRWVEAYASHSLFAHQLVRETTLMSSERPSGGVLIAGCGDVFPSISSRWEPRSIGISACDLSEKSLFRARCRSLTHLRTIQFQKLSLDHPLPYAEDEFSHIDAYGVLHHLANPSYGLASLSQHLAPGGTMRVMVYNRKSRNWIHQIQKIFHLLDISPYRPKDRKDAYRLLDLLAIECPALRDRLQLILPELKVKTSRFVDTFLHAREARIELADWLKAFTACSLKPIALFDRYAELDDIPNPLYQFPKWSELEMRASDRRFENNWEIYLLKEGRIRNNVTHGLNPAIRLKSPPISWFQYDETRNIPWLSRQIIWQNFLTTLRGDKVDNSKFPKGLSEMTIQRLVRIGAIWASNLPPSLRSASLRPIHESMEVPARHNLLPLKHMPLCKQHVAAILAQKQKHPRLLELISKRIEAAQDELKKEGPGAIASS